MTVRALLGSLIVLTTSHIAAGALVDAVVIPQHAGFLEAVAGREVCRYVYLRTGDLPRLVRADSPEVVGDEHGTLVMLGSKDRSLVRAAAEAGDRLEAAAQLGPQGYMLFQVSEADSRAVVVIGGDANGTLYGAYRLIEHLGVRFYLHGDVIPDAPWRGSAVLRDSLMG